MDRRSLIVLAGVFIGVTAVLVVGLNLPEGPSGGESDTGDRAPTMTPESNGGKPSALARIAINPEVTSETERSVSMRIEVDTNIYGYENISYENPRLCLYDENGTVLGNESLRDIESPIDTVETVNVTVNKRPIYYTVEHPELRTDDRFQLHFRRLDEEDNIYRSLLYSRGEYPDSFDYPRTNQTGHCP